MNEERDEFDLEVDSAWRRFRTELADELAALEVGQAVHVGLGEAGVDGPPEDPAYVVFVLEVDARLRVEAGGGDPDPEEMLERGWGLPCFQPTGEAVHELIAPAREVDRFVALAVDTLRDVHGCLHPALLEVDGLSSRPEAPEAPETDEALATVPLDDEHLRTLVRDALRPMTTELVDTDDGDMVVPVSEENAVVVRVLHDEPALDLLMEVVCDVADTDRLPLELELLNRDAALGRYLVWEGSVVITHRLVAMPFAPITLRGTVAVLVDEVERVAADLLARVGGRMPLEREVSAPKRAAVVLHPAVATVVEMLHEDETLSVETVAHVFGHDRHELVRQLVALRRGHRSLPDLDLELVLAHLRRALRLVADQEAGVPTPLPGAVRASAPGAGAAAADEPGFPQESLKNWDFSSDRS